MKKQKLTDEEAVEISEKIESEGFDYYFTDYGCDEKLEPLIKRELKAYMKTRKALVEAVQRHRIQVNE